MEAERTIRQLNQRFGELNGRMSKIVECLQMSEMNKNVHDFDTSQDIEKWLDLLDKMKLIYDLDDKSIVTLAYMKSTGTAARMICRIRKENPTWNWDTFKVQMRQIFSKMVNSEHWTTKLWQLKQRTNEEIYAFIERLYYTIERAYGTDWEILQGNLLNSQLITVFLEGLKSEELKRKIFRKDVKTLKEAVDFATKDDITSRRFPIRKEKIPRFYENKSLTSSCITKRVNSYNYKSPPKQRYYGKRKPDDESVTRRATPKKINVIRQ